MVSAIIVAAGSSRRMGFDKLFAPLRGQPVLWHSVCAFDQCEHIDEVIVVGREDKMLDLRKLLNFSKVTKIVVGGEERHLSVWNGLQAVSAQHSKFVAIHDGARPLVTPSLISECLRHAQIVGAACCAAPIPDTVKRASNERFVEESVERAGLWAMQTPQIFASSLILQAYVSIMSRHELVTDEVSAVQKLGKKIYLHDSGSWNFKITYPKDIELAERVLDLRDAKNVGASV